MIRVRTCTNRIQEFPYARLGIFCTQGYRQVKIDRASLTARNSPSPIPAWPYGTESRGAFPLLHSRIFEIPSFVFATLPCPLSGLPQTQTCYAFRSTGGADPQDLNL